MIPQPWTMVRRMMVLILQIHVQTWMTTLTLTPKLTATRHASKSAVLASAAPIRCVKSHAGRVMPHMPAMLTANVSASHSVVTVSVAPIRFARSRAASAHLVIVAT